MTRAISALALAAALSGCVRMMTTEEINAAVHDCVQSGGQAAFVRASRDPRSPVASVECYGIAGAPIITSSAEQQLHDWTEICNRYDARVVKTPRGYTCEVAK